METHPQKAEDMPIGSADLSAVVRTIDPIIDQLIDGAVKGALHADDLVDIGVRIRTVLHEAVARQHSGTTLAGAAGAGRPGAAPGATEIDGSPATDAALVSGTGG
jgi:hypothetical protein